MILWLMHSRGKTHRARVALREAIDEGWRGRYWRYYLEYDSNPELVRDEPEFQVMMEKIKNDITKQLAQDKEMEPGDDACVNL